MEWMEWMFQHRQHLHHIQHLQCHYHYQSMSNIININSNINKLPIKSTQFSTTNDQISPSDMSNSLPYPLHSFINQRTGIKQQQTLRCDGVSSLLPPCSLPSPPISLPSLSHILLTLLFFLSFFGSGYRLQVLRTTKEGTRMTEEKKKTTRTWMTEDGDSEGRRLYVFSLELQYICTSFT